MADRNRLTIKLIITLVVVVLVSILLARSEHIISLVDRPFSRHPTDFEGSLELLNGNTSQFEMTGHLRQCHLEIRKIFNRTCRTQGGIKASTALVDLSQVSEIEVVQNRGITFIVLYSEVASIADVTPPFSEDATSCGGDICPQPKQYRLSVGLSSDPTSSEIDAFRNITIHCRRGDT